MSRLNAEQPEERALDALGMLALLSRDRKERTPEELESFLSEEAREAELTQDEVAGTGMFAFDRLWSRIREDKGCSSVPGVEPEAALTEAAALHRGESEIPPEALKELERRRREALGDEDEDDGADIDEEGRRD